MATVEWPKALGKNIMLCKVSCAFVSLIILKLLDSNSKTDFRRVENISKKIVKINADVSFLKIISRQCK